jgi:hypothetical protein
MRDESVCDSARSTLREGDVAHERSVRGAFHCCFSAHAFSSLPQNECTPLRAAVTDREAIS